MTQPPDVQTWHPFSRSRNAGIAFAIFVFAVAVLKLVLAAPMPVQARPDDSLDDMLFLELAQYIAQGDWLGPFSERTLAKGPIYPIFVGFNILSGFPLKLTEQVFYLLASYFFASSVGKAAGRRWVTIVLFAALAFNPAATMAEVAYVLREGIYPALTLLVFGCSVRMMLALKTGRPGRPILWGACLGLSLGITWLTREEGIWLIPAVAVFIMPFLAFRRAPPEKEDLHASAAAASGSAIVAFVAVLGGVAAINWAAYGVFATNDYRSGPFAAAFGALQRIAQDRWISHVPLPNSALRQAYEASPAFRSIWPAFEQEKAFRDASCRVYPDNCGEIAGGWMSWALRMAAARTGYYRDAGTAHDYWERVATEINGACDAGRLKCDAPGSSLAPPVSRWPLERLPASFLQGAVTLVTMRDISPQPRPSLGNPVFVREIESVVNQGTTPVQSGMAEVWAWGWILPRVESASTFLVLSGDGTSRAITPQWHPSPDLAAIHGPSAGEARFLLQGFCLTPCRLRIEEGGTLRHDVALQAQIRPRIVDQNSSGTLAFDRVLTSLEATGTGAAAREIKIRILKWVGRGYSLALPVLTPVAVMAFAAGVVFGRKDGHARNLLVLLTALVLAVVTRLAVLTVVHETSFPALYCLYLAAAYPLLIAFVCVSIYLGFDTLRRRFAAAGA